MQAVAYEGYFNNGQFYSSGKTIPIPEKKRVVLTILEDSQALYPSTSLPTQRDAVKNFLEATKRIREEGFTAEDDKAIEEFQSGAYKIKFEK